MRAVVQRVSFASVTVDGAVTGKIDKGLLVFLGVGEGDGEEDLRYIVKKVSSLRVFEDEEGKMNKNVKDAGGKVLTVSQFTLYGDVRKGARPSFTSAAAPSEGEKYYELFKSAMRDEGLSDQCGSFGADMKVSLLNDGPVTILLDSKKLF